LKLYITCKGKGNLPVPKHHAMKAFRELLWHHPFWTLRLSGQFQGVFTFTPSTKDPGTH